MNYMPQSKNIHFAIIIPTWNNLHYLRLCIESIKKNSFFSHEIIVHVNEGNDGTREYLKEHGIRFTESTSNVGVCVAVNQAASISNSPYICYLNDDMYCLPQWDSILFEKIQSFNTKLFMISGTMIEPKTRNPCAVEAWFGNSIETFQENELLEKYKQFHTHDWYGSCWPPFILHRDTWNDIGGFSEEFSPGMSSENDLAMKLWYSGCRIFLGMGQSMVYHFQCKSTGRVVKNPGPKQFLQKWKISSSFLDHHFLRSGQPARSLALPPPKRTPRFFYDLLRSKVKLAVRTIWGGNLPT